ncbi:MAG: FAD-binding oxidoreductase [Sphingobacterium sp.]|uniref:FAD-binding oxidoreductase n=1 Tax=Sphingobacterium sp. JB170 TaxID=1434842 RepID=UPI00097F5606|nr:FAD-binding oxidoreductase [Sphingobacterium sp. JB170]SJN46978.1 Oxidoreductase FAD-binding domain protein [Sphingobacterium sp. JB170]
MISSIPKWVSNLFGNTLRPNVKIVEISYLSPQIKKIRFQGDISKWSFQIGFASVVRVSETEFRNYTIAYHDKENGIFDIVFHIHGSGIGSQLINSLKTNDELFISPPRGKKFYEPSIKQQFIVGDETSLGLACSFLSFLRQGQHQFQFYFELDEENRNVPELLGLENCTIFFKNGSFRNKEWISNLPIFQTLDLATASFVLSGNVKSVQTFRQILKNKTAGKIFSQGYWLEGKKGL